MSATEYTPCAGSKAELGFNALADRPMTLRMEAFGAQYGESWVKTQKAGMSRFDAGTGNGGVVYLPPELDLLDVERASYVPTASTSYVAAHPGVYWASGYARVGSGDVKTGYRWGGNSSGVLAFDHMSSAGVATTVFSLTDAKVASFKLLQLAYKNLTP